MLTYIWIGLGSAIGGVARHLISEWSVKQWGIEFPWGTLIVNSVGSFLIGFVAALAMNTQKAWIGLGGQQFLMIGVLGGFTTFSSFSLQNLNLFYLGIWPRALANIIASLALGLLTVWLGHKLGNALIQRF